MDDYSQPSLMDYHNEVTRFNQFHPGQINYSIENQRKEARAGKKNYNHFYDINDDGDEDDRDEILENIRNKVYNKSHFSKKMIIKKKKNSESCLGETESNKSEEEESSHEQNNSNRPLKDV